MQAEARAPQEQHPNAPVHHSAEQHSPEQRQQQGHSSSQQADAAQSGADEMQVDDSMPPQEASHATPGVILLCHHVYVNHPSFVQQLSTGICA